MCKTSACSQIGSRRQRHHEEEVYEALYNIRKKVNYIHTVHNLKYKERIACSTQNSRENMK
jgi:predicted acylesterase/phospholipase RssA